MQRPLYVPGINRKHTQTTNNDIKEDDNHLKSNWQLQTYIIHMIASFSDTIVTR